MATYTCDPQYTTVGSSSRVCQSDGFWSGANITCELLGGIAYTCIINRLKSFLLQGFSCGPPPTIRNGSPGKPRNSQLGRIVEYSCNTGYELSGSVTVICQASEIWNTPPSCIGIYD